jgi:rfaE bifunctional protein kinase chain/domain
VISGNQHLLRIDDEENKPIDATNEEIFIKHIVKILNSKPFDAIIFQDYDKGAITPNVIDEITFLANSLNIPTLVDPKKRNFSHYAEVSLFKPNFKEFCEGIKKELSKNDTEEIYKFAQHYQESKNIGIIMITLSEKGLFISNGKTYQVIPAEVREITDVSGAGDTVISMATLCLTANMDMKDIAIISNKAGGLVCEKAGVVPVDKVKLMRELGVMS